MFITVTKYRPDCTPIKQVVIDFEDDTLFDADEDELEFIDDDLELIDDELACDTCPDSMECTNSKPDGECELDGQTTLEDLLRMIEADENGGPVTHGTWTINFKS